MIPIFFKLLFWEYSAHECRQTKEMMDGNQLLEDGQLLFEDTEYGAGAIDTMETEVPESVE